MGGGQEKKVHFFGQTKWVGGFLSWPKKHREVSKKKFAPPLSGAGGSRRGDNIGVWHKIKPVITP